MKQACRGIIMCVSVCGRKHTVHHTCTRFSYDRQQTFSNNPLTRLQKQPEANVHTAKPQPATHSIQPVGQGATMHSNCSNEQQTAADSKPGQTAPSQNQATALRHKLQRVCLSKHVNHAKHYRPCVWVAIASDQHSWAEQEKVGRHTCRRHATAAQSLHS